MGSRRLLSRCLPLSSKWRPNPATGSHAPAGMKRDTTVSCCLPRDQTGASDWFAFAAAPLPRHELIAWQPSVHGFPGDFDAGDRKTGRIELADLHQHRSLIPIEVFTGQLSISELGHHDSG